NVVARIDLGSRAHTGFGAEGLLWAGDLPVRGLSPNHDTVPVAGKAAGGEPVELYVEAAANPPSIPGSDELLLADPDGPPRLTLRRAELAVHHAEVEALALDLVVLLGLLGQLPAGEPRSAGVVRALERACDLIDPEAVTETAEAARAALAGVLAVPAVASAHRVSAVGHAHIDTAWLWPLRETQRKCARTFPTAVSLMDEYPDYRFACSQPQQYAWIKERYPRLWDRIAKKVADGQFEPVGAMWVEADCNVPSGESLVRQLVHGKRFFMDTFGHEVQEVWLP